MPDTAITIRRLGPADAALWRKIRIEALQDAPEAFGQTHAHAMAQPLESFERTVSGPNPPWIALAGDRPVGTVGIYVVEGPKTAHRGMLWGMYVAPDARGAGLAERLVTTALGNPPPGVTQVHLRVVTGNAVAYRLYRRMGFEPYGIEPRALRFQGRDYDEVMMVRLLDRTGGTESR